MKKTYNEPKVEIYYISKEDEVIVTSGNAPLFLQGGHFFAEDIGAEYDE